MIARSELYQIRFRLAPNRVLAASSSTTAHDLHWWINEALMVVFFLVVGLEIKREILSGALASLRQAALPVAAAAGGMIVPFSLKVFLTALAIVDDIGAVLVIALFYTSSVSWLFLAAAAGILVLLAVLNVVGVRNIVVYAGLGMALWLMVLSSGLHATLAGILLAMTIPATRKIHADDFLRRAHDQLHAFQRAGNTDQRLLSVEQQEALITLENTVEDVTAPLQRMEDGLHPWVVFFIIPLFALVNAGVTLGGNVSALLLNPVSLGILVGLVIGKQVGITLAAWLAVKLRIAELPAGVTWRDIYAVGWLAGIGFTMSLFISELAFGSGAELEAAKVGILAASLIAGGIGYGLLKRFVREKQKA